MTLTKSQPPGLVDARPTRAWWRAAATSPVVQAAALTAAAFGVRSVGLIHSFELWVDEMLYADLGASASRGELPRLEDGPFFLHPPGFFVLEGAVIRLFRIPTGDPVALVLDLRWLTAAIGALTVGVAFLLIRRLAGTPPAAWGAVILALEPFVLRINSRVFLESLAGLMLLAGLLVIVMHVQQPTGGRQWREWPPGASTCRLFAGGLLLGYAVLTKDAFAFFAVVPIVLAVVWRRTLALREAVVVLVGAAMPYTIYLVVVAANGLLPELVRAKVAGVLRLIGTNDFTGFNAPGAPSLVGRLVAQAEHYGTSYVILLLCPLAGLVAACSARPERRLIGLTALATGAYGLYMVAFGTAEEQYAYPILVTGVAALAVAARMLWDRMPTRRTAAVSVMLVFLVAELVLGARQELTRDDGLLTFRAWAAKHLPANARVGATNGASGYAFADDPRFGPWPTARLLELHGAHYVLTFDLPTREGYTLATPAFLAWLHTHATALFRTYGPTNGNTVLWYIDPRELALAATQGVGDQPGTREPNPGAAQRPQHETHPNAPVGSGLSVYIVRSGDTLGQIAREHHTTVAQIAGLNHITNVNLILSGQHLRLPGSGLGRGR